MRTIRFQGFCVGLLLAGVLFASGAHAADVTISEKARAHFSAGVSLLQDPDGARYEEAYSEFRAAYADSPSWKILGNLGITAMKLERDGEAIDAFKKYLAQGGNALEAEEKAQMQRDLDTLTAGVVTLELTSVPAGAFVIDERIAVTGNPVKNSYGPLADKLVIGVRAGQHRITAHLEGYQDQIWMVDARSGTSLQHQFAMKQAPAADAAAPRGPVGTTGSPATTQARPIPTSFYIGLAATGALAVGTGVVGALSLSKHSDFDSKNDGSDPAAAQDLKDSGKTLNLVTDVLLGATVVAGGVTAVLYFSRPSKTVDSGRLRLTPVAGPRLAGLSVAGAF
jgi:hypothetical protein